MPNDPYLDASVRWKIQTGQLELAEPRYRAVAAAILEAGLATSVLRQIGSGKEADVYLCRDGSGLRAVKVYRTYRTANHVRREAKLDSIGHLVSWEYDMLVYAWRDGARVPRPWQRDENAFAMQYLGDEEAPAPRLRDAASDDWGTLARRTVAAVESLVSAGVVHTDLSPYNVLVDGDEPWIIDVGRCLRVDRLGMPPWLTAHRAAEALRSGVSSLARFFAARGAAIDAPELVARLLTYVDRFGVLDGP